MNLAHVARAFLRCIFAASAALLWRVCAAQVKERRRAQRFSRFGVVVECLQFAPFPQNYRKFWWKVSTFTRSVCVWYRAKVAPVEGTPPPFLRPFRRSLSDRGFLACRTLSPRRVAHRFAHVMRRAACLRASRVLGYSVPTVSRATFPAGPLPPADNQKI